MPWFCHQIGSREHYSIPRALARTGDLALLQTDAWVRPNWQWLPKAFKQDALASRFHPDLEAKEVKAFTLGRVGFDLWAKLCKKDTWTTISERDIWFQQCCLPGLESALEKAKDPIVFAYAYTARMLFKLAKAQGATCVLGQIDPGPGELAHLKTVLPEAISSLIEDRPASYWEAWREEVDLADRIVINSPWSKELLVRYSRVPEHKIEIIPLAYTPENVEAPRNYPKQFSQARPLRLLFLGQVIHRKGVHLLLQAMKRLAGQTVRLDLVGPLDPEFEKLTEALPPQIKVHGPVDRERARQFYRECDVFILPTLSDGFALTQLEAAAHQLPIIASRFCAPVVEDGKNGLLLPEVTGETLATAIETCLKSPSTLTRWANHRFDWSPYSLDALGSRLETVDKKQ